MQHYKDYYSKVLTCHAHSLNPVHLLVNTVESVVTCDLCSVARNYKRQATVTTLFFFQKRRFQICDRRSMARWNLSFYYV